LGLQSVENKGFERLKGLASASLFTLGGVVGSAHGVTTTLPITLSRSVQRTVGPTTVKWGPINNGFSNPFYTRSSTSSSSPDGCQSTFRLFQSGSSPGTIVTDLGFEVGCGDQAFGIHKNSYRTELTTGNTQFGPGSGRQYDNLFSLAVNDVLFVNPSDTVDLTDNIVTSDTVQMSGIDVSVQYAFFDKNSIANNRVAARATFTFTNTGSTDAQVSAKVISKVNNRLIITGSSDGNTTFSELDQWIYGQRSGVLSLISSRIVFAFSGLDAALGHTVVDIPSSTGGGLIVEYPLDIPAEETVRVVAFTEVVWNEAEAISNAIDYNDIQTLYNAGFLEGMSDEEITQVVNYAPLNFNGFDNAPITPASNDNADDKGDDSGGGALASLIDLFLLGSLALFKLLNRRKISSYTHKR